HERREEREEQNQKRLPHHNECPGDGDDDRRDEHRPKRDRHVEGPPRRGRCSRCTCRHADTYLLARRDPAMRGAVSGDLVVHRELEPSGLRPCLKVRLLRGVGSREKAVACPSVRECLLGLGSIETSVEDWHPRWCPESHMQTSRLSEPD